MKTDITSFKFIKKSKKINFPIFSRKYEGNDKVWTDFLDSLMDKDNRQFFFGSIIAYHDDGLMILDGKQRIITASIIFRILDLLISESDQVEYIAEAIWTSYKVDNSGKGLIVRIKDDYEDSKNYDIVMRTNDPDYISNLSDSSDIIKCFNFYYNRLSNMSLGKLLSIYYTLTKECNLILMMFSDSEDLFKLKYVSDYLSYSSISGLLFENYFSFLLSEDCNIIKANFIIENLYRDYWYPLFDNDVFWKFNSKNKEFTNLELVFFDFFREQLKLGKNNMLKSADFSDFKFENFKAILVDFCDFANKYRDKFKVNTVKGCDEDLDYNENTDLGKIIKMIDEGVDESGKEVKIGKIICKLCYDNILWKYLTADEFSLLFDEKYCNKVFGLGPHYPFLSIKKIFRANKYRYYAKSIIIDGRTYYITNEWYREQLPKLRRYLVELNSRSVK